MTVVIIDTDMNSILPEMNCIHKDRDKQLPFEFISLNDSSM
jgi:hypothetical protein